MTAPGRKLTLAEATAPAVAAREPKLSLSEALAPYLPGARLCLHRSRGGSECLLDQGHADPLHSDLVLLWNERGELCNLDGRPVR